MLHFCRNSLVALREREVEVIMYRVLLERKVKKLFSRDGIRYFIVARCWRKLQKMKFFGDYHDKLRILLRKKATISAVAKEQVQKIMSVDNCLKLNFWHFFRT